MGSGKAEITETVKPYRGFLTQKDLTVGEDVMYIVVAGDIREHVIDALRTTLDTIKTEVTRKTQYFA